MQKYCKIPKISPGAYIFQRPFLGAYFWREICISKSIGLALQLQVNYFTVFAVLLCIGRKYSKYKPSGAYIWRGDLTEGFLRYWFGGLIHGGACFWNFMV